VSFQEMVTLVDRLFMLYYSAGKIINSTLHLRRIYDDFERSSRHDTDLMFRNERFHLTFPRIPCVVTH
jgi:hypothetical protein